MAIKKLEEERSWNKNVKNSKKINNNNNNNKKREARKLREEH
jgi:hypothetical protein